MSRQSQQNQLNREFSREDFEVILRQLLTSLQVNTDVIHLPTYDQIAKTKGKVIGQDIVEVAEKAKQQTMGNFDIFEEIDFYRKSLSELRKNDIISISKSDFQKKFVEENPQKGIITTELTEKIENLKYVSVVKLQKLIDSIEKSQVDGRALRISSEVRVRSIEASSIIIEDEVDLLRQIQTTLQFVQNKVYDPSIREHLESRLRKMEDLQRQNEQNDKNMKQVLEKVRDHEQILNEQIFQLQKVIDVKNCQIDRLEEKVERQHHEISGLQLKANQFVEAITRLEEENDNIIKEKDSITAQNEDLSTKIEWFRENYQGLSQEYEQFLEKVRETERKAESEKQNRLFVQRTTKEQLEDAHAKISRLRAEVTELKQKNVELEMNYENRIESLQLRLKQAEEISQQKLGRISRQFQHSIYNSKIHDRSSIVDNFEVNSTTTSRSKAGKEPKEGESSESSKSSKSSSLRESVVILQEKTQSNIEQAFKKKKAAVSASISVILTDEIELKINEFDEIGILQNKQLASLTKAVESLTSASKQEIEPKSILSGSAYIIHESGSKFPIGFILSSDRFTILDSKMRLNYTIKFGQLRQILFCYHNITWMVLKVREKQMNQKSQQLSDMVISLHNRAQVLEYLERNCIEGLKKSGVQIRFQKEENIWVRGFDSEILLSNFTNYYNVNRISTNNSHNIFEANIKQVSLLSWSADVLIVVCSLGILAFQMDGDNQFEKNQNLQYLLPIVQKMQVIQMLSKNDCRLKITYETEKKAYRIKMSSYALIKKLKRTIEEQRQKNLQWKRDEMSRYAKLTELTKSKKL